MTRPAEFAGAIDNPLKGFRPDWGTDRPYCPLHRRYVPWNAIEQGAGDSVDRIIAHTNRLAAGLPERNIKLVPRVYLDWDGRLDDQGRPKQYWPADLHSFDYESPAFWARVKALVAKLGQAWDEDPRIAFVQMGLIGFWGEMHNPTPGPEQRRVLAEAFRAAFPHKPVLVRQCWPEFTQAGFGIYYDTFANGGREPKPGDTSGEVPWQLTNRSPDLWRVGPIEGEVEYNWQAGDPAAAAKTFGINPNETMVREPYRRYMIDKIRRYHASYLGWISGFDAKQPDVVAGAGELMKVFGYRYVLTEFGWTPEVKPGGSISVRLDVRNDGSAPMYADWPVALALLDPGTHQPLWQTTLTQANPRAWLPGSRWNSERFAYDEPAATYRVEETVTLPANLPAGEAVVALAILDRQGGMVPSARFAIANYWRGGWHPLGRVGIGAPPKATAVDAATFVSPAFDDSLRYQVPQRLLDVKEPPALAVTPVTRFTLDPARECLDPHRYWQLVERGPDVAQTTSFDGPGSAKVYTVRGSYGRGTNLSYYPFNQAKFPPGRYRFTVRVKGTPGQWVTVDLADNWQGITTYDRVPLTAEWVEHRLDWDVKTEFRNYPRLRVTAPDDATGEFSLCDYHLVKLD
ncbi:MAG: DUF4832 domain-containing protein [Armatimonadetes bacterium]|nr:DUF4832 domain-containing protein [Armatimonadota bacterium]